MFAPIASLLSLLSAPLLFLDVSWALDAIAQANLLVGIPIAFIAGLISFASPCVFPLVPGYIAWMTGLSNPGAVDALPKWRILVGGSLFVLGFAVPLTLIGLVGGSLYHTIAGPTANLVMGGIVLIFGVLLMDIIPGINIYQFKMNATPSNAGLLGALPLGFVFGIGWTPCIGPALGAILTMSVNAGGSLPGGIMALAYALGLGIPFIIIGLAMGTATVRLQWLKARSQLLQKLGGGLLALIGILMATGMWDVLMRRLLPYLQGMSLPI